MQTKATVGIFALILCVPFALGQQPDASGSVPIYRVTVVSRTIKAINYQYRAGPTRIAFRGTVLLPEAEGDATVESKRGRTEINSRFEKLPAPARFGREYMTYVLWAITPEGRPQNIGEIVPNGRNKASLDVTTELQAFALIVTAEPYSAVRQPSDLVVLENEVRYDTTGTIKDVVAKYELLPRGHYTWHVADQIQSEVNNAPKVSMSRYEALLALGEAQNAIGIARAASAGQYAASTLARAEQLFERARQLDSSDSNSRRVVENAREAIQTAEDARLIAEWRMREAKLAEAGAEATEARRAQERAEALARQAQIEASDARAQAEADRAASREALVQLNAERERAERERAAQEAQARAAALQAEADRRNTGPSAETLARKQASRRRVNLRMRLLEELNGIASTRDTPRGLVVTVPDGEFQSATVGSPASERLRRVARIVATQPGLKVDVEGHTDSSERAVVARQRAYRVRELLVSAGVPDLTVQAIDRGDSRPLVSNTTEDGRVRNRRVEIVISGDPMGTLAFWDRTYDIMPSPD